LEPRRPTFSDSWHRVESLTPRLRPGVLALRRHFRGETWHILEDPLAAGRAGRAGGQGAFFRLNDSAYRFIALLDGKRSVAQAWKLACDSLGDDAPTQPEAVTLLGQLGAANLLQGDLPEDARALFRRYRSRTSRELKGTLASLLSIRLPLIDPDRALTIATPLLGRAFTWFGFIAWLALIVTGIVHLLERPNELWSGIGGVLSAENLGWLYAAFVLSKVIHELGHAVACKWFSRKEGLEGPVHTMGVMLLVFMPAPFVDATSAWAIRSKWARVMVGAAGMYAELALAALAAVVWSRTAEGTIAHSVSYNLIFIAGVSTLVFNANPLMKYDGYFILADILETPNLANRAREQFNHIVQRFIWRVRESTAPAHTRREGTWLVVYHLASAAYRCLVFVTITLFVMDHWLLAGALIGTFILIAQVVVPLGKLGTFLASSPRLNKSRSLATWTTLAFAAMVLIAIALIPVPDRVRLEGVIESQNETGLFAPEDGFIAAALAPGSVIDATTPAVTLTNDALLTDRAMAEARSQAAQVRRNRAIAEGPARARDEAERAELVASALKDLDARVASLSVRPPGGAVGQWVPIESTTRLGTFVHKGQRLGTVTSTSNLSARCAADQRTAALLTSLAAALPTSHATLRPKGVPAHQLEVTVNPPAPAGRTNLSNAVLADNAGGPVRLSPSTDPAHPTAAEPYFDVLVSLPNAGSTPTQGLRPGQRVIVRIDLPHTPLLNQWVRAVRQTFQQRFSV
jgi:putative peptide zinc metalloprotease protein